MCSPRYIVSSLPCRVCATTTKSTAAAAHNDQQQKPPPVSPLAVPAPPSGSSKKRVRFEEREEQQQEEWESSSPSHDSCFPPSNKKIRLATTAAAVENDSSSSKSACKEELIGYVKGSGQLTEHEKTLLWAGPLERARYRQEASDDAHECRKRDNKMILSGQSHFCFRETYSNVYTVCNFIGEDGEVRHQDVCETVTPEVITFLAACCSEGRGIEDRTAPRVAVERRLLRSQMIKLTLQAQEREGYSSLSSSSDSDGSKSSGSRQSRENDSRRRPEEDDDVSERVGRVARALSRPSRKFGEALGLVDATAAIMVYTEDGCVGAAPAVEHRQECKQDNSAATVAAAAASSSSPSSPSFPCQKEVVQATVPEVTPPTSPNSSAMLLQFLGVAGSATL